jgi:signal transduction histidine kinase
MDPTGQKNPAVVYRRPPEGGAGGAPRSFESWRRGIAPAVVPLVIGFVLLLGLITTVGLLSVSLTRDVSFEARDIHTQRLGRLTLLWNLRKAVDRLDNEARARARTEASSRELTLPFDLGFNSARAEINAVTVRLDSPPLVEQVPWRTLRDDLQAYIKITEDPKEYSLKGFNSFKKVDEDLNILFADLGAQRDDIILRILAVQANAGKQITRWMLLALLVGALVTAGTIWQVQRHFNAMQRSISETRRERKFATQLLEGTVSAVAAVDEQDRIRSANVAFFKIFPLATVGASVLEKLGPPDAMKILEAISAVRVNKATYLGRLVVKLDAEDRAFDVYSSPLALDGDRGQIVTLVDATEAAAAERTLRRGESLAAVGQATTQVAHEIRNPLGSIRLGVSMLRDSVNDPDALNTIELVERGIKHLNKLVVDVTQFSRQKELERSTVELHESLERSIDLVSERIREKNTNIEKVFAVGTIVGQWDPYQLRQVFVNVIANAVDASLENSAVHISTERLASESDGDGQQPKRYVRITIADEGKGMDQATRDRIFEPFFSTKKRGTGLGLAIVKQIVEQHGGRISVASEPGKGSKFNIDLPF